MSSLFERPRYVPYIEILTLWTYLWFLRARSFSLGRGTGKVWLEINSGLFNSTSPVVSCFFARMAPRQYQEEVPIRLALLFLI